jgi:hypothetical protein
MQESEPFKTKFEYELKSVEDNRYLATMTESFASVCYPRSYKPGDSIPLTDGLIHRNNSRRLRKCIIERMEKDETKPNSFVIYLRPTNEEIKPENFINWERSSFRSHEGIDWSGSDGWLNF